ncbi:MAG: hypothetical protein LAN84_08985 [Acidobacteriia bacterium]|nr:hypothetical protein [Terriglobia bacterium]
MTENHKTPPETPTGKKPYSKPSVSSEPIYETQALACHKVNSIGTCSGPGNKTS